jgi:hypothetical protein
MALAMKRAHRSSEAPAEVLTHVRKSVWVIETMVDHNL